MSPSAATAKTVNEYLERIGEPRRADARRLHKLIRASGPELKHGLALHVTLAVDGGYLTEAMADRFPKADVGESCIRFRHLSDLDEDALVSLLRNGSKAAASQTATTKP